MTGWISKSGLKGWSRVRYQCSMVRVRFSLTNDSRAQTYDAYVLDADGNV